jgi:hypothetical protein
LQGTAPITSLSETSSDPENLEAELSDKHDVIEIMNLERLFVTGVLDELKVCFSYSKQVCLGYFYYMKLPCDGSTQSSERSAASSLYSLFIYYFFNFFSFSMAKAS